MKCCSQLTVAVLTDSVHPLGEVVARFQCSIDLRRVHGLVLGQILGILPFEELDTILSVRLAAKVAICSSLLILGFAECKGHGNGTWTAIELDLDDVSDVVGCQITLLCTIGLHEE